MLVLSNELKLNSSNSLLTLLWIIYLFIKLNGLFIYEI